MIDEMLPNITRFEYDAETEKQSWLRMLFSGEETVFQEPYNYKIGAIQLNVSLGSRDAFDFIKSLCDSPNDEVLRSEIVKRYSNYMWN
jgi:hypothetical protein